LVDDLGNARLADFGLMTLSASMNFLSTLSTKGGSGTVHYLAPELLNDDGIKTYASDVYAYAMLMYEVCRPEVHGGLLDIYICYGQILSATRPWSTLKDFQVIIKMYQGMRPEKPSSRFLMLDIIWDTIVSFWQQRPEDRPKVAHAIDAIDQVLLNKRKQRQDGASPSMGRRPRSKYAKRRMQFMPADSRII
jgi:serine/threonine protein kinase